MSRFRRKKRIIICLVIILFVFISVNVIISGVITNRAQTIVQNAYSNKGEYDLNELYVNEDNFKIIAAESINDHINNDENNWDYDIAYVHTVSNIFGAYTYVRDTCNIYDTNNSKIAGYKDRHIRLHWRIKDGKYVINDVYEYVTPDLICTFFDFFE